MSRDPVERFLAEWALKEKVCIFVVPNMIKSYREFIFLHRGRLPNSKSKNPVERCLSTWAQRVHLAFKSGILPQITLQTVKHELGLKWLNGYDPQTCEISVELYVGIDGGSDAFCGEVGLEHQMHDIRIRRKRGGKKNRLRREHRLKLEQMGNKHQHKLESQNQVSVQDQDHSNDFDKLTDDLVLHITQIFDHPALQEFIRTNRRFYNLFKYERGLRQLTDSKMVLCDDLINALVDETINYHELLFPHGHNEQYASSLSDSLTAAYIKVAADTCVTFLENNPSKVENFFYELIMHDSIGQYKSLDRKEKIMFIEKLIIENPGDLCVMHSNLSYLPNFSEFIQLEREKFKEFLLQENSLSLVYVIMKRIKYNKYDWFRASQS